MKKYFCLTLSLTFAMLITGCSSFYQLNEVKYRTRRAHTVIPGGCGIRIGSIFSHDFIFQDTPRGALPFRFESTVIEEKDQQRLITANIAGGVASKAKLRETFDHAKASNLNIRIDIYEVQNPNDLVKVLNSPENNELREKLTAYDNPRIVTAVLITDTYNITGSSSNKISGDATITLPSAGNPEISGNYASGGNFKRSCSKGSVFAFEYSRLCWKKGQDGKLSIFGIIPDRPGFGQSYCAPGTFGNPREAIKSATTN